MHKLWIYRKATVIAGMCGLLVQGTIVCDVPAVDVVINGIRHYDDDHDYDYDDDCCDDHSFYFDFWETALEVIWLRTYDISYLLEFRILNV